MIGRRQAIGAKYMITPMGNVHLDNAVLGTLLILIGLVLAIA